METLIISLVLLTTLITGILTYIDIAKRIDIPKQKRINLCFALLYLPLIGPVVYFSILRKKYISDNRRRP
jgi:hypothetical protein